MQLLAILPTMSPSTSRPLIWNAGSRSYFWKLSVVNFTAVFHTSIEIKKLEQISFKFQLQKTLNFFSLKMTVSVPAMTIFKSFDKNFAVSFSWKDTTKDIN